MLRSRKCKLVYNYRVFCNVANSEGLRGSARIYARRLGAWKRRAVLWFVWMEGHPELKAQRKQQLLYRYGGAPHCFLERHASQECPACKHEEIKRTMRGTHDGMVKSCTTRAKQRCLPDRLRASVSQARRLLIEWGGVPSNTCRYCCYCQVRLLLLLLGDKLSVLWRWRKLDLLFRG